MKKSRDYIKINNECQILLLNEARETKERRLSILGEGRATFGPILRSDLPRLPAVVGRTPACPDRSRPGG